MLKSEFTIETLGDAMFIVGRSDDDKEKPQDIVDKD